MWECEFWFLKRIHQKPNICYMLTFRPPASAFNGLLISLIIENENITQSTNWLGLTQWRVCRPVLVCRDFKKSPPETTGRAPVSFHRAHWGPPWLRQTELKCRQINLIKGRHHHHHPAASLASLRTWGCLFVLIMESLYCHYYPNSLASNTNTVLGEKVRQIL